MERAKRERVGKRAKQVAAFILSIFFLWPKHRLLVGAEEIIIMLLELDHGFINKVFVSGENITRVAETSTDFKI